MGLKYKPLKDIIMKNFLLLSLFFIFSNITYAQIDVAPDRARGEGPFNQLIIRGATMENIDQVKEALTMCKTSACVQQALDKRESLHSPSRE